MSAEEYSRLDGTKGELAKYRFKNDEIVRIAKAESICDFIFRQQCQWIGHYVRAVDKRLLKQLTFLAYFKSDKLKFGVTDSTFRQVIRQAQTLGYTEHDIIRKMRTREFCVPTGRSCNSTVSTSNHAAETR